MTKRQILAIFTGVLTLIVGVTAANFFGLIPTRARPEPLAVPVSEITGVPDQNIRLSGPYTHKNLTVFLVHGEDVHNGKTPLTLDEAMERKLAIVHETGEVDELSIENISQKDEIYVQAGDIVKGGQQDRVLAVDLIVPARSGRIPIDAFCVEHGRWTARGGESVTRFESATEGVPSKDMKLAAKHSKSQDKVWNEVEKSQEKLTVATRTDVTSNTSRSSLPLALENSAVRSDSGEFIKALSKIVEGKTDVIGFAFAINNEINSADTYGSSALFAKLWLRLLKAAAIEAIAETDPNYDARPVPAEAFTALFTDVENAAIVDTRTVTDRIRMSTRESEKAVLIESLDSGMLLHRNYITK